MISAWARMCKILGDQFVQYLPVVMKPLLHAAKMRPEVAIVDGECVHMCVHVQPSNTPLIQFSSSADETAFSEDDGWEFITLADQVSAHYSDTL